MPIPAALTPIFWLNGPAAPAFADLAGTVPAVPGGPVRRINQLAPLTGSWVTPAGSPGTKDAAGISLQPVPNGAYPLQVPIATGIQVDASWAAISWVQRRNQWTLLYAGAPSWGVYPGLSAYANNGNNYALGSGFNTTKGHHYSLVLSWTTGGIKAKLMTDGVLTASTTITPPVPAGSPSDLHIYIGQFQSFIYGAITEIVGGNGAISDPDFDALLAFVDAAPAPEAYPVGQTLVAYGGDSIVVGEPGVAPYDAWCWSSLRALLAGGWPDAIELNVAYGGSAATENWAGLIAPYYSASRDKQVFILAVGTNDIATNHTAIATVAAYYANLDAARAQGWPTVACTLLARSGLFGGGATQQFYNEQAALFNQIIRATWRDHADALADAAAVPHMGAPGDALNLTYFQADAVHPTTLGQSLIAPVYTAALAAALNASPPVPPVPPVPPAGPLPGKPLRLSPSGPVVTNSSGAPYAPGVGTRTRMVQGQCLVDPGSLITATPITIGPVPGDDLLRPSLPLPLPGLRYRASVTVDVQNPGPDTSTVSLYLDTSLDGATWTEAASNAHQVAGGARVSNGARQCTLELLLTLGAVLGVVTSTPRLYVRARVATTSGTLCLLNSSGPDAAAVGSITLELEETI